MMSTTFLSSASIAEYACARVTVSSSASTLRPRSSAMLRRNAAASFVAFDSIVSGRSSPVTSTGEAAPMFVPLAIAATCPAAAMNVPADAA